jgi:AsmA protein
MRKSVKIALVAVIALPILAASAIHHFVDANTFRPIIEQRLSTALSRKVTLGDLSLSLSTGSLVASDLAIADDPKFGQAPFFTAKRLRIGVQMKPLLFHKQLIIRSFEVDKPQIHLIDAEDGSWNFSTLSHAAPANNTQPAALSDLPVGQITIKDGSARIDELASQKNPQVYDHLDVRLEHFSLTKGFPFTVSASLPGDGKVDLSGKLGPINPQDATSTTLDAHIAIQHLDPVAAGYVEPGSGISLIGSLDAHVVSDGTDIISEGKLHAEHLILLKSGKAAPYPVDVTYQVTEALKGSSGQVADLALQTGAVAIHIQGSYHVIANVPVFDLKLTAPHVPIDDLQAILPAVGVKLPNNATLHGGTLTANFAMKGSAKDNVITGSYEIQNTKLVGYNLGSKIVGIAALGGIKTGDSVVIDVSRADVRITKAGSESTNIYSKLPAMGESTGSGRVSPSGQLDFHLISTISNAKGLNKFGINLLTKLNSTSAASKPSTASGIPILITGTAENPVITADVSGLVKGNEAALRSKGIDLLNKTGLSKLFGRKRSSSTAPPK